MIHIVNELDETTWRQYTQCHPHGNIFHSPEMAQVLARAKGYRPSLWAAVDDDNRPLALFLPVQVTLFEGILHLLTSRAILYGSVLCDPGEGGQAALTALLQAYKQHIKKRVLFTELRNLSDLSNLQPVLSSNGFVYEEHLNYLVDLARPVDAIMQGIGSRTRKKIRRALRDERMQVTQITQREQVGICYELLYKTYAAVQIPLADRSLFEAAFEVLHPRGMVQFWLARVEDAHIAASVELLYKDVIYGWYSSVDRAYADLIPGELLMWHILRWGAENGYKVYDFGGAGKPNQEYGVRDFKAKFGGQLVCYGRNTCVHAPGLLRLSAWGYQIYTSHGHKLRFSKV